MSAVRSVAAKLALVGLLLPSGAYARPAAELCPLSPQLDALGILRWDAQVSDQPDGSLVTCVYRANNDIDLGGQDISFSPICPAGQRIVFPGYKLNGVSRTELRVIGLVPKSVSSGVDTVDMVVFGGPGVRKRDVSV